MVDLLRRSEVGDEAEPEASELSDARVRTVVVSMQITGSYYDLCSIEVVVCFHG